MSNERKPDYIANIDKAERRFITHEVRQDTDGKIEGIASRAGTWYDMGFYEEQIAPGAFDDVMGDDVRALFNHDPNLVLARTKSKTLTLFQDDQGSLGYRYETPKRTYAIDLEDSIRSGDVDQSSFAFRVAEESWEWADEEKGISKDRRTIVKMEKLYDVSPVTYPANPDTTVAKRAIDDHYNHVKEQEIDLTRKKLEIYDKRLRIMDNSK